MGCARPTGDSHGRTPRGPAQRRGRNAKAAPKRGVQKRGLGQYRGRSPKAPALCRISHVDFRGIRLDELPRILIPRTPVNKDKDTKGRGSPASALTSWV